MAHGFPVEDDGAERSLGRDRNLHQAHAIPRVFSLSTARLLLTVDGDRPSTPGEKRCEIFGERLESAVSCRNASRTENANDLSHAFLRPAAYTAPVRRN